MFIKEKELLKKIFMIHCLDSILLKTKINLCALANILRYVAFDIQHSCLHPTTIVRGCYCPGC